MRSIWVRRGSADVQASAAIVDLHDVVFELTQVDVQPRDPPVVPRSETDVVDVVQSVSRARMVDTPCESVLEARIRHQ